VHTFEHFKAGRTLFFGPQGPAAALHTSVPGGGAADGGAVHLAEPSAEKERVSEEVTGLGPTIQGLGYQLLMEGQCT
jgi:hypothetical protein